MADPMKDAECQKMIGSLIGEGGARRVFAVDNDGTRVIKEVHLPFVGGNLVEWFIWCGIQDTTLRDCFGECHAISESGRYLFMERLDDIGPADYPDTPAIPEWVGDVRPRCFGRNAAGKIKLRDYNSVRIGGALAAADLHRRPWQETKR
jgi:hypothetical protein